MLALGPRQTAENDDLSGLPWQQRSQSGPGPLTDAANND